MSPPLRKNDFPAGPAPSSSTPALGRQAPAAFERPRRHTITRPESALALLPDLTDEDEQDDDEQRFGRISDILSNLIQEANDAIQDNAQPRLIRRPLLFRSKLPRPKSKRSRAHVRIDSVSSSSSTSSASSFFAPPSPSSTSTSISRSPSPTTTLKPSFPSPPPLPTGTRPLSCSSLGDPRRRSMTPRTTSRRLMPPALSQSPTRRVMVMGDPLAESFKRLDSSLALVESLSRDLATSKPTPLLPASTSRLTLLLLFPLLHIPHALISMIFGIADLRPVSPGPSSSLAGLLVWTCFFALANLVMDRVPSPMRWITTKTARRLSLPGSYLGPHASLPSVQERSSDHALHGQCINNHVTSIEPHAQQPHRLPRRNSM